MNRHERRARAAKTRLVKLPVVKRQCGECTACCTLLGVPELEKARYSPCEHDTGKNCNIYEARPHSCRVFKCIWLQGLIPINERPDKIGIVWSVTVPKPGKPQYPVAMEVTEGASKLDPALSLILKSLSVLQSSS